MTQSIEILVCALWDTCDNEGATIQSPRGEEGGLQFLSRRNYLFQPGPAARWKFQILLHVYVWKFWKKVIYFMQSLPEIMFKQEAWSPMSSPAIIFCGHKYLKSRLVGDKFKFQ